MNDLIDFPNVREVLTDYINELKTQYENNLLDSDKVASYNLINSIQVITSFNGTDYWIGFQLADYWKYVENDTKPHFPPVNKLLEWIRVKPVLPYPNKNGKLPTPNQLAYLIGRKIDKEGTKGTHDLERANRTIYEKYEELITLALEEDVSNSMDKIIKILYV
jgi:ribosomal protein S17E